jgi:hypothetical protein
MVVNGKAGLEMLEYLIKVDLFFFYGSTDLYGPGPPRFVEASRSHT